MTYMLTKDDCSNPDLMLTVSNHQWKLISITKQAMDQFNST